MSKKRASDEHVTDTSSSSGLWVIPVILFLFGSAFLGWKLSRQDTLPNIPIVQKFFGKKPSISPTAAQPVATAPAVRTFTADFTEDEKTILKPPTDDTDEAKQAHRAIVEKLAQPGTMVTINKCEKPSPLVLALPFGEAVTFVNNDTVEHTVGFSPDDIDKVTIPPNGTGTMTINFKPGPGVYGYGCDTKPWTIGIILAQ